MIYDKHGKARQIKELRRQGIIPASSLNWDRREKRRRKSRLHPNRRPRHRHQLTSRTPKRIPRPSQKKAGYCDMCERVAFLTRHHLIPKHVRARPFNITSRPVTVKLCVPCHGKVHSLFTLCKLKDVYNTLKKLKSNPKIQEHIKHVRKENPNILPVANG